MRPLRVIHVSLGLHMGGMEKLLVEFAKHTDRARYELHFISMTDRGNAADEIERLGNSVTVLNAKSGMRPSIAWKLGTLFRRLGADVVHTHNTKPLLYAAAAARCTGVKSVIHTRHGQRLGSSKRQTLLFNLAAQCADKIVSVSNDSTDLAERQGLCREKLLTIHNGIDLSKLPYSERDPSAPLAFVGRLSPEKDVASLLRAVALLRDQGTAIELFIAGDGPDRPALEAMSSHLQLDRQVRFLGMERNVPALLSRSSIMILPSLSEGVSLALLEAMASGTLAIATAVGGNVEVIRDGVSGLLVPPQDSAALAAAILRLRQDTALARSIVHRARETVVNQFDVCQMVRRYESLYESTLRTDETISLAA